MLHPHDEKGAMVERKREEIYMHDANGEETHGIHRRVQSGRERQEKRAGHCSCFRRKDPRAGGNGRSAKTVSNND